MSKQANKTHWEYITNYSSIIHAVVVVFWAFFLLDDHGVEFEHVNFKSEMYLIYFSFGYFLTETIMGRAN
jgi:hypothetical protein